jgi:hypothetical protein
MLGNVRRQNEEIDTSVYKVESIGRQYRDILVLNKPTMALATTTVPQQIGPLDDES